MFRAAVSDIDASDGWVKCGHCRKVFDCRENEIKPADFVSLEEPGENDSTEKSAELSSVSQDVELVEDEFVPQISLFDEPGQPKKSSEDDVADSAVGNFADSHISVSRENKSAKKVEPVEHKLPSVEQKPAYTIPKEDDDAVSLHVDRGDNSTPSAHSDTLHANRETVDATSYKKSKKDNQGQHQSILKNRLNVTKPHAPGFSASILAKVQSWKKQRKHFKKTRAYPNSLIAVVLFAVLIWQMAIVNYTKLSQYSFLSAPLMAVCSIITCNHAAAPKTSGFEILHASVRRHTSIPNVMSITAKLINFSDENKLMPTLRLDLTNDNNTIIASRTIALPENPQFVDPALTELAPGQDVQLIFDINNPDKSAHGFQLSLVSH